MKDVSPKIFISHASLDSPIGERFLEALIELGIKKENVFYSSSYHTGVKLGKNFHEEVKKALNSSEIVVFLLTPNFYKSEFCLNEMGAVWYSNKKFIPILLNGLTFNDMKGFIDSHYIAFKPNKEETFKLLTYLNDYIEKPNIEKGIKEIFNDFITVANEMSEKTSKLLMPTEDISDIEKMVTSKKFTDEEILFLNYFIENKTIRLKDYSSSDYGSQKFIESEELLKIKEYSKKYDFDYEKAKEILEKSGYIIYEYDDNGEYVGCELDINFFRDLISMSTYGNGTIENVRAKHERVVSNEKTSINTASCKKIETLIKSRDFKEIEALLFKYILDTYSFTLGDRWKASEEIQKIRLWEENNSLDSKLSRNYDTALRMVIFQGLVEVESTTSYGNPKEYKIKDAYVDQLIHLDREAKEILDDVVSNNKFELPF